MALCFGEVIPLDPPMETVIEFSHRLVAGIVGILVILMAIWSWTSPQSISRDSISRGYFCLYDIFQGLLGAGAVVFGQ